MTRRHAGPATAALTGALVTLASLEAAAFDGQVPPEAMAERPVYSP